MTLREAAQQALEALEQAHPKPYNEDVRAHVEAITALRAALEQLEQEPVAWMYMGIKHDGTTHGPHLVWKPQYMDAMSASKGAKATPLYTTPPRREWQSLTVEDKLAIAMSWGTVAELIENSEAKLKEKNHG